MFNYYEEKQINNRDLPSEWQSSDVLIELEKFLQENWDNRYSFYNDGDKSKKQQFLSFLSHDDIRTNNYIGTIGFNGQTINIFPKVFREKYLSNDTSKLDTSHMIKNLVLWINYCNKTEYPFINFSTDYDDSTDLKELFISIYIRYIDEVLNRNAYFKYEIIEEDIPTIRGRLNIVDYITKKVPYGKNNTFNCEFSTFDYDNTLNRIIKCTCRLIFNSTSFANQRRIRQILMKLNDVSDVNCVPSDCDKLVFNKSQEVYKTIASMSKMFLMNQLSTFTIDKKDNFCFLFPTESLFEGFIGGFLTEMLEGKATVTLQKSSDYLFEHLLFNSEDFGYFKQLRYDIFVEFKESNRLFILDTKYKMLCRFNNNPNLEDDLLHQLRSEDVYQVLEYANKNDLRDVYLLYPLIRKEDIESSYPIGQCYCRGGQTNIHIIKVPFVFEDDDAKMKSVLKNELEKIFI